MRNLFKIKKGVFISSCLTLLTLLPSCNKSFEVTDMQIEIQSKFDILREDKVLDVLNEEREDMNLRKLDNWDDWSMPGRFHEYEYVDFLGNRQAGSKFHDEISNQMETNNNLKKIHLNFKINNNTKEVIETAMIALRIQFQFENMQYNFIKITNILKNNKTWNPDEVLAINLNNFISLSYGASTDVLDVHTPKKVNLETYLIANNSVGYSNVEKSINEIPFYDSLNYDRVFYFGFFTSKTLNDKRILDLGEKIYHTDITNQWIDEIIKKDSNLKYQNNSLSSGATPYNKYFENRFACYSCSEIKVEAPHNSDVLVILKRDGNVVQHAYIRASDYKTFWLENGTYQPFFYYGKGWNPNKKMKGGEILGGFISEEHFGKDTPQDLNNQILEYQLTIQLNGNFSTRPSNEDEAF